jgi:hypothetical protein
MYIRQFFQPPRSRGGQSLHFGKREEVNVAERLAKLVFHGIPVIAGPTAGGGHGDDVVALMDGKSIGFEVGTPGKFEGGGCTLRLIDGQLRVPADKQFLYSLMGDYRPWNGVVPPLTAICADDYLDVPSDSIARYYREKGTHYISLNKGLYHTGDDVLSTGVPFFEVPGIRLRTRVTKHLKKGKPTDYTTALVFPVNNLVKSPYSLFGVLPPGFTEAE